MSGPVGSGPVVGPVGRSTGAYYSSTEFGGLGINTLFSVLNVASMVHLDDPRGDTIDALYNIYFYMYKENVYIYTLVRKQRRVLHILFLNIYSIISCLIITVIHKNLVH